MSLPIRPSAILAHSLGGALGLRREQGVYPVKVRESIYNAWALGLERRIYIQGQRHIFGFAIDHGTGAFLMIYDDDGPNSVKYACISHPKRSPLIFKKLIGLEASNCPTPRIGLDVLCSTRKYRLYVNYLLVFHVLPPLTSRFQINSINITRSRVAM